MRTFDDFILAVGVHLGGVDRGSHNDRNPEANHDK